MLGLADCAGFTTIAGKIAFSIRNPRSPSLLNRRRGLYFERDGHDTWPSGMIRRRAPRRHPDLY